MTREADRLLRQADGDGRHTFDAGGRELDDSRTVNVNNKDALRHPTDDVDGR